MKPLQLSKKKLISWVVIMVITIIIGFIPPVEPLTTLGMQCIGAFVYVVAVMSMNLGMWACFPVVLYLGICTSANIGSVSIPYVIGSSSVVLMLFVYMFSLQLAEMGVSSAVGTWLISRKFVQKNSLNLMVGFWLASYVVSVVTFSGTSATILMIVMYKEIAKQLNIKQYGKFSICTLIGCAVMSFNGTVLFGIDAYSSMARNYFTAAGAGALPLTIAFLFNLIVSVVYFVVIYLVVRFLVRPEKYDMDTFKVDTSSLKLNKNLKWAIVAFALYVFFSMIPNLLPSNLPIVAFINRFGTVGILTVIFIVLSLVKKEDHTQMFDMGKMIRKCPWEVLVTIGTVFLVINNLNSAEAGIPAAMQMVFAPLGNIIRNPVVLMAFFVLLAGILTQFVGNGVLLAVISNISFLVLQAAGVSPAAMAPMATACALATLMGIALPTGSAMGMILASEGDLIRTKDMAIYGYLFTMVLNIVIIAAMFIITPLSNM